MVRFAEEKVGGRRIPARIFNEFNDCISACSFEDLKATGCTWS